MIYIGGPGSDRSDRTESLDTVEWLDDSWGTRRDGFVGSWMSCAPPTPTRKPGPRPVLPCGVFSHRRVSTTPIRGSPWDSTAVVSPSRTSLPTCNTETGGTGSSATPDPTGVDTSSDGPSPGPGEDHDLVLSHSRPLRDVYPFPSPVSRCVRDSPPGVSSVKSERVHVWKSGGKEENKVPLRLLTIFKSTET